MLLLPFTLKIKTPNKMTTTETNAHLNFAMTDSLQPQYDELFKNGVTLLSYPVNDQIKKSVEKRSWEEVDQEFYRLCGHEGELFKFLQRFHRFQSIEHMLAIRDPSVDEGIWHDDGSRYMAFTISLTKEHHLVEGGNLLFRKKGQSELTKLPTPEFGVMTLFLTGHYGYEHKIQRVEDGERIVLVGWCS